MARHLERIEWRTRDGFEPDRWPYTIPAVAQLWREEGLEVPDGVSFLVGENGSGKSTLVEAFAAVYPRRGFTTGSVPGVAGVGPSAEDSPLRFQLRAVTNRMASPAGFFLRAELMHGLLAEADADPRQARAWGGERLQERSHGESFLAVLRHRFAEPGVYFLDEPEAALSFQSTLGLMALLDLMRREGSQVVVATHSPLLVSLPGATLFELDETGMHRADYDDLELVTAWRAFLDAPQRYLRHLLE